MNDIEIYDTLRHMADSWGLLAMMIAFMVLCYWPFRPGAASRNNEAANAIFEEDDNG